MKNLILIFGAVVFFVGCTKNESIVHDVEEIVVVDSTGLVEDINAPGTFFKTYDTLVVTIDTKYNIDSQESEIVYSAKRK